MSKAGKNMKDSMDFLKNSQSATNTTTTTRIWSRKRDDGSYETTTETTKDFSITPSESGARLGAIAGGIAGWIFGPA